jgi:ATP/maltotriose-dependent transcriptional regulator MalT
MTTLLGIVSKLPPQIVASRARLQLTIAWANLLLQRQGPMQAAVNRFQASMTNADLEETTRADLKAEADVLQAVAETHADRTENVERSGRRSDVEAGHSTSAGARGGRKYRRRSRRSTDSTSTPRTDCSIGPRPTTR